MSPTIEMIPCINPGTGEVFNQIPSANEDEVARAHKEMRESFEVWRRKPVKERVRILRKLQKIIIDSTDIISETINKDTGKSRQDGLIEVFMAVDRLNQYNKKAPRWLKRERIPKGLHIFKRYYTDPAPYGVVAIICPWNYPFELMMSPLYSALLAGNTVLLKPSEWAAATGELVEKLIQSVPELSPFVRVLHGDGRVGADIVQSKPDLIFLTGSVETGYKVAQAAAENMTPYLFELGGKDPMIVLEDADIKAAARWGAWGAFYNTGQTCISIERVYVVDSVYDAFIQEAVARTESLKLGYLAGPDNPNDLGPLTFERQKHIIEDHLEDALSKGARILIGGKIEGMFVEPTIMVNVDHSMKIMRDETFGPIMPIMKVKDEAEAIHLANDSYLGLSASIWSKDLKRAERVASQLEVGAISINDTIAHYGVTLLPFGGMKKSGNARTHGEREVRQFTQSRSVALGNPPPIFDISARMRSPGYYRLGAAIMRLVFGVTPGQRVQPIVEELERVAEKRKRADPAAVATAGVMAALAALAFGLLRSRK